MNRIPSEINIADWEKFGDGNTAETFFSKKDEGLMLKLYVAGLDPSFGYEELLNTEAVTALGISTPKAIEYVKCGDRYGAVYERVQGKKSFAKLIGEQPERAEDLSRLFAREAKKLHGTECNTERFPSAAEYYEKVIRSADYMTDSQKERALAFIAAVPAKTTCIHGDLHFGNIVMDKFGKVMFIDLPEFCCGNPYFDFGMSGILLYHSLDERIEKDYHMSAQLHRKCWDWFFMEYFGISDQEELEERKKELKQYAGLSCVYLGTIFRNSPRIPALIEEYFGN